MFFFLLLIELYISINIFILNFHTQKCLFKCQKLRLAPRMRNKKRIYKGTGSLLGIAAQQSIYTPVLASLFRPLSKENININFFIIFFSDTNACLYHVHISKYFYYSRKTIVWIYQVLWTIL